MNALDEVERFNRLRLKGIDGWLSPDKQIELDGMMQARLDEAVFGWLQQSNKKRR